MGLKYHSKKNTSDTYIMKDITWRKKAKSIFSSAMVKMCLAVGTKTNVVKGYKMIVVMVNNKNLNWVVLVAFSSAAICNKYKKHWHFWR